MAAGDRKPKLSSEILTALVVVILSAEADNVSLPATDPVSVSWASPSTPVVKLLADSVFPFADETSIVSPSIPTPKESSSTSEYVPVSLADNASGPLMLNTVPTTAMVIVEVTFPSVAVTTMARFVGSLPFDNEADAIPLALVTSSSTINAPESELKIIATSARTLLFSSLAIAEIVTVVRPELSDGN